MARITLVIFGAIIVLIILVLIASAIANTLFKKSVAQELTAFTGSLKSKAQTVQLSDLESLPLPVQNWLNYSGIVGKERITTVYSKQNITMRLKANQAWMAGQAEQYVRTEEPGFIWIVDIKMAPLLHIAGRDKYVDGQGNMLIKILSLITVANARGKEIDQGSLVRYLAEIVWYPSAALSSYIQWEGIDSHSAKATMSYQGVSASGVFTFNDQGQAVSFVAERYRESEGEYRLETWLCKINEYKAFDELKIPAQADLVWKLETGDFHWYHLEVEDMEFGY
jgi:hypothetical protein